MGSRAALLVCALHACWPAPASGEASVLWTSIEVRARLDDQGRLQVAETHRLRLPGGGGLSLFREFGLGADQALASVRLTRLNSDGSALRLVERDVEKDPGRFRYYPRGHAYFLVPELPAGAELGYRFEYELERAVLPAWGIGAGRFPQVEGSLLIAPWRRLPQLFDDWRAAWPDPWRRYFLDHCVLYPSRDGPGYEVQRIDYQLELGPAWRRVQPDAPLASVEPDVQYRVRPLLEYLGPALPGASGWREAATRLGVAAGVPLAGLLAWLLLLVVEALATRGAPALEPVRIQAALDALAPESLPGLLGDALSAPQAGDVLARLAAEGKLQIEILPADPRSGEGDDEGHYEVRLRRLCGPRAPTAVERVFLAPFFPRGDVSTSAEVRAAHARKGFDPSDALEALRVSPPRPPARPLGAWIGLALGFYGLAMQLHSAGDRDLFPLVLLFNLPALALGAGWPRAWWCAGRPRRGLLVPLVLFGGIALAAQLGFERPLAARAWIGAGLVVLGSYAAALVGARMPASTSFAQLRELLRIRAFAARELRRAQPRLDDRWNAHLVALGLGRALARWRARHAAPGRLDLQSAGLAAFNGRELVPPRLPAYWTNAFATGAEDDAD